ncbi:hypothetical protein AHMF7605_27000 [Adhaeribacter arboris]|uniref:DUF4369 domain-containing protein n=1 Tax=Adhaeribacter arboris TaxID=2072846 RepID=A0A2T2YN10_9BACT|nr:hypothetical protein [Adhaeribacter arboris]PSR56885.1 hypothetical protein AHMF7605_27000 [Adhaeribacter arboris]
MKNSFGNIFSILTCLLLLSAATESFACTCAGKDKLTTENGYASVNVVVKGTVISVSDYNYYDTAGLSLTGLKFDPKLYTYMIRKYKAYRIAITNNFKPELSLSDTLTVITGQGGGDCGFEFEIGKEYIVYSDRWTEREIVESIRKRRTKRSLKEVARENVFYTDICSLTQEANATELKKLESIKLKKPSR